MDIIEKELESRRAEIQKGVELLFKANMTFTNWDIPEVDDERAAKLLIAIMKEEIEKIEKDVAKGKYNNY